MGRAIRLIGALLVALVAGCGAPAAPAPPDAPAARPIPHQAAALAAYEATRGAAANGEQLRAALDQVELALAVAPAGDGLRGDLLAAEADLVARLARLPVESRGAPATLREASPPAEAVLAAPPAGTATAAPSGEAPPAPAASPPPRRPSAATPAPPPFAVATRTSFDGSGNSGQFASCIDVQIMGRGGPVAGAVLGINNGEHSYQDQTDQGGYSGRCGLGASTWSVVLFWTPAGGEVRGAATTVYLSGAPEQRAAVVFTER